MKQKTRNPVAKAVRTIRPQRTKNRKKYTRKGRGRRKPVDQL